MALYLVESPVSEHCMPNNSAYSQLKDALHIYFLIIFCLKNKPKAAQMYVVCAAQNAVNA